MNQRLLVRLVCLSVALCLVALDGLAASMYETSIQNQTVLSGGVHQFDVYVKRTGSDAWRIADATFQITFNASAFTGLTISYVTGSTELGPAYTVSVNVSILRINVEVQSPTSYATSTEISSTGTRIGTFRLSTINDPLASANLAWRTPLGSYQVMLERVAPSDDANNITNPSTVSYLPVFNAPLPITFASFGAKIDSSGSGVRLEWMTVTEINNYGFYVQRRGVGETGFVELPGSFVAGHGTTNEPQQYTFTDRPPAAGAYYYRLRQVDLNGSEHFSGAVQAGLTTSVTELAPMEFSLLQNYPNPFNPETVVKFSVKNSGPTTVRLYNSIGQEVATLFDDVAEAGQYYRVKVNGSDFASGVYFYRLQCGTKSDLKKMLLLK